MSGNIKSIPIDWESSGYSVLKNLDASILGMFCEFIDNSIQSYRDDKLLIQKFEPNFQLKVDLIYNGQEIIIKDNAGGIDSDDFERAMKPANKPKNKEGLNEFGIGMKYAAVWVSNEWVLKSKSYKENVERTVTFNYHDVVTENLKHLPTEEKNINDKSHYTIVILRQLESRHTGRWQEKYLKSKLASIYRNFIRAGGPFYEDFIEDPIEIRYNGELLTFTEHNFLKAPWWKDIQIAQNENAQEKEWKWKFPWRKIEINDEELTLEGEVRKISKIVEVTGFIGILPDGDHKGKNGFALFRRGRVIEGIDSRVTPVPISTNSARSFKYIRMYGEIHFRNIDVSFNKSKLSIDNETRNDIFAVLAEEIKKYEIDGDNFDMLQQADKHRVGFKIANAKNAIELRRRHNLEKIELPELFEEKMKVQQDIAKTIIDESYDKQINKLQSEEGKKILDNEKDIDVLIGTYIYKLKIHYITSDEITGLYTCSIINDHEDKIINVGINLKHHLFTEFPDNIKDNSKFNLIIEFVKCLAKSEVLASNGINKAKAVRHAFNLFSNTISL